MPTLASAPCPRGSAVVGPVRYARHLVDPVDHTPLRDLDPADGRVTFGSGRSYPVDNGIPILVPEESSFDLGEILSRTSTTQAAAYRTDSRLKNRVRKRALPTLSVDRDLESRYRRASAASAGSAALVLGAGDMVADYRRWLSSNEVIASDVHLQFDPDLVFDAHWIPFGDATLGLVVAGQVLEHTIRPWRVAEEIERVVQANGLVQIEVPFAFPLHSAPWDFFRFTVGGLRSLFRRSQLIRVDVSEGNFSGAAAIGASALTSCFTGRYARMGALLAGRFGLGWLKYLDRISAAGPDAMSSPKGIAATFRVDKRVRSDSELIGDVREVLGSGHGGRWAAGGSSGRTS